MVAASPVIPFVAPSAYRGGCFATDALDARIGVSTQVPGDFSWRFVGFRAARSVE